MAPPSSGSERFAFRFDERYARIARRFGITPDRAWVEVGPEELQARFGPWRLRTPLTNLERVSATGPYRFAKTAGPARLGITDLSLTMASNGDRGAEIELRHRTRGIEPFGLLPHRGLTVTVADVDGLIAKLRPICAGEGRDGAGRRSPTALPAADDRGQSTETGHA